MAYLLCPKNNSAFANEHPAGGQAGGVGWGGQEGGRGARRAAVLAAFPQQDDWRKFGEAYVIFDTKLYPESSRPIEVVSCDVQFQGALPSWQFDNSLIRWLYVDRVVSEVVSPKGKSITLHG